jgi:hypothetical protein
MSRPVIALAAFSLAAAFNSECEDSQHGSHRKNQQEVSHNHDRQRAALKQSLGCNQAQQHRSRRDPCRAVMLSMLRAAVDSTIGKRPAAGAAGLAAPGPGFRLLLGRHDEPVRGSGRISSLTLMPPCRS